MKKIIAVSLLIIFTLSFFSCKKGENIDDGKKLRFGVESQTLVINADGFSSYDLNEQLYYGDEKSAVDCEWRSENPEIVTVGAKGIINAVSAGNCRVFAANKGKEASVEVYCVSTAERFELENPYSVRTIGRVYINEKTAELSNSSCGVEVNFIGKTLTGRFVSSISDSHGNFIKAYVDGKEGEAINIKNGESDVTLCSLSEYGLHTVKIMKMTEQAYPLKLLAVETDGIPLSSVKRNKLKMEFYGDSISCGYGINRGAFSTENEDSTLSFCAVAAEKLNAEYSIIAYSGVSLALKYWVTNFTVPDFYDTYTAINKEKWDFGANRADVVIINLGTNDSEVIGSNNKAKFREEYKKLVDKLYFAHSAPVIVCQYGMMNNVSEIAEAIKSVVAEMNSEGKSSVYYQQFESRNSGHPDAGSHKVYGEELADFLADKI